MIVGGVAVGALSIASAFALFQFMRRGSGPDPVSESKSTPVTEPETEEGAETIVELAPRPLERLPEISLDSLPERPLERSLERPSLGLSIGPSVGLQTRPSTELQRTSESSNPPTYLSIDTAHVEEITNLLTVLKKRFEVVQKQ